jgi:hypothetical protein
MSDRLRLVIVESPYAGEVEENVAYARACIRDCLLRGEAPIASHLLFTQPTILNDDVPHERTTGMAAGLAWYRAAEACAVYTDRGISDGMRKGIDTARAHNVQVHYRSLRALEAELEQAAGAMEQRRLRP